MIKTPKDLALHLEETHEIACWRYNWITPANKSDTNKKVYHYEYPKMSSEDILLKRGWTSQPKKFPLAEMGYSLYLKYIDDLYCIDFDTKDKCNEDNEFWQFCQDLHSVHFETTKGSHFYFYIVGMPAFTCFTKLEADASYGDVDMIGRKVEGQANIVELAKREAEPTHTTECCFGGADTKHYAKNIITINWEDVAEYLNTDRMNMDAPTKKQSELARHSSMSNDAISTDDMLDEEKFVAYLERLGANRFHYQDWFLVGCICHNNFADKDKGFGIWFHWTKSDPTFTEEHPHRTLQACMEKWESMGSCSNPAKWQTLRGMVCGDDKSINPYQELYDVGGSVAIVKYMNEFLFLNRETSETIMLDPEDNTDMCKFSVKKDNEAKLIFKKYKVMVKDKEEDKGKMINPYDIWCNHLLQRQIVRVIFDPSPNAPENAYNVWNGFDIPEDSLTEISLADANIECQALLQHIRVIWCKNNEELYNYTMSWFAFILQKPWIKIGVMLCVKSKEGSGKGIVFDFMRSILGSKLYAQINSVQQLVGDFNSVLEGKLLINCDEAHWGGDIKTANKMKGLITEGEVWINEKNRKQYCIKNTTALCLASNEQRATSAREGDRRHYGLELDNKWAGKQTTPEHRQYFVNISGQKDAKGIKYSRAQAFAKILFNWDLSNFNVKNPPNTDFIDDQMERNWSPIMKWWHGILKTGQFTIKECHKRGAFIDGQQRSYDARELDWGWIHHSRNTQGIRRTRDEWVSGDKLAMTLKLPISKMNGGLICGSSKSYASVWLNWCDKVDYDWGDVNYKKLPVPDCVFTYHKKYLWTNAHDNRPISIDFDYGDDKLRDTRCPPNNSYPIIRECDNPDMDSVWFRERDGLHFNTEAHKSGFYDEYVKEHKFIDPNIIAFPRKSKEFMGKDGEEYIITDKVAFKSFIDKWSGGVNSSNFHEDLISETNFKGKRLESDCDVDTITYWSKAKVIIKNCYNKDFLWEKYEQSVGLGYGSSNNQDAGVFWKDIKAFMGGPADGGGSYSSFRMTMNDGTRRQLIDVPPIETLRKHFSQHIGRVVKWVEDGDTPDLDIHDIDEWILQAHPCKVF